MCVCVCVCAHVRVHVRVGKKSPVGSFVPWRSYRPDQAAASRVAAALSACPLRQSPRSHLPAHPPGCSSAPSDGGRLGWGLNDEWGLRVG